MSRRERGPPSRGWEPKHVLQDGEKLHGGGSAVNGCTGDRRGGGVGTKTTFLGARTEFQLTPEGRGEQDVG